MKQSRVMISSSEDATHRAIYRYLKAVLPAGWIVFHPPNGGSRHPIEAARMKGMGVTAGIPDLVILGNRPHPEGGVEPLTYFLEVKSAKGRPSLPQLDMHDRLLDLGFAVGIARSIDDAKSLCIRWNLPIRDASAKEAA
jgi:hypothetical protein